MASLASLLPNPVNVAYRDDDEDVELDKSYKQLAVTIKEPPPYGRRHGWIPRKADDFGDGGAFPEIHIAQYPLDMGKKNTTKTSNALPVQLDAQGRPRCLGENQHAVP